MKNLFAWLTAEGFSIALINPIRTRRFAEEELQRTKTDHVDALGIARFAAQKRPQPTRLSDQSAQELRHIVHLRERTIQHLGDRVRDLHRAIDLTFPEFTRHVRGLDTELAIAILTRYPTAHAVLTATVGTLAAICFDGRRRVGQSLARALICAAQTSVGQHQTEPYERQVRYACQDILAMRVRARELETDIHHRLEHDEVGKLLTTIQGISTLTAAVIIAELAIPHASVMPQLSLHTSGYPTYASIRKTDVFGEGPGSAGQRTPEARALDAGAGWNPCQPVAASSLSASPGSRQTTKSCDDRLHAQTAGSNLQCRQEPAAVRCQ